MPKLLPVLCELNELFGAKHVHKLVQRRDHFAPGERLDIALSNLVAHMGDETRNAFKVFVGMIPPSIQESLRGAIFLTLSSDPPLLINWAWAPAYDYELNVWHIVEPAPAPSGITLLLRTRYPDDPRPAQAAA